MLPKIWSYPRIGLHNGKPCVAFLMPGGKVLPGKAYKETLDDCRLALQSAYDEFKTNTPGEADLVKEALDEYAKNGAIELHD